MMRDEVVPRIEAIFAERLKMEAPSADTELLESGLLDSLQFVDLLSAIEREFRIGIPLAEIDFDRLTTLGALGELVDELRATSHDAAAISRSATRH